MVKARKWVLMKHFNGFPKESDFKLVEEELPEVQDGEILVEASILSVDPYMRGYSRVLPEGSTMIGGQLARVTASKNSSYPDGTYVIIYAGWRDKTVTNPLLPELSLPGIPPIQKVNDLGEHVSNSIYMGALGMTGMAAYFGLSILEPKAGEVVLVSTAAGAVGSIVGQIAKIKGCTVIGSVGSDDKVKWIKEELGFDHAFNYKTCDIGETLKKLEPDGIHCYFDNVGGSFTQTVLRQNMRSQGRVSVCGAISHYNDQEYDPNIGPYPYSAVIGKQLKIEGFMLTRWLAEFPQAGKVILGWVREGKIKHKEDVTEGFANMPKAFIAMLEGKNKGKAVVKI